MSKYTFKEGDFVWLKAVFARIDEDGDHEFYLMPKQCHERIWLSEEDLIEGVEKDGEIILNNKDIDKQLKSIKNKQLKDSIKHYKSVVTNLEKELEELNS